ncbi:MAG TPA: GNAT family N-acetyltransferase, partial [Burkholderiaceae bacterium]|nr:GNAT family N-acetyltransferase [Burkholderiaceae bacterium]
MAFANPVTLSGEHARLELLSSKHHADLVEAVKDGELWKLWYTSVPSPENVGAEIERRLGLFENGSMLPFAVIELATGQAVGMTTYMHIDAANRRVEIGSTWYRRRVQRSGINTECKLMLLTHAFEELDCIAVEWRTHFLNHQSRAGIER